jgi:hypothetical protein
MIQKYYRIFLLRKDKLTEANYLLGLKASVLEERFPKEEFPHAVEDLIDKAFPTEEEAEIAVTAILGYLYALGDSKSNSITFTIKKLYRIKPSLFL